MPNPRFSTSENRGFFERLVHLCFDETRIYSCLQQVEQEAGEENESHHHHKRGGDQHTHG